MAASRRWRSEDSELTHWSGHLAFSPEFTLSEAEWGRVVIFCFSTLPQAKKLVLSVVAETLVQATA